MSWLLAPVSWCYGAGVRSRVWWYQRGGGRVHTLGRPVVSVGNLTVGGTGKTPLVIALGEALLARGVDVAVLSRGYGGGLERVGGLVSDGSGRRPLDWPAAGDEPALIARRLPRAAVIVGRDRVSAWSRFGRARPPGVCLLDDGFQHLAIARDEDLLVLDATESYADAALLPRGRLREPLNALARASAVVVTRVDQAAPGAVDAIEALVRRVRSDVPLFYARFALSGLAAVGAGGAAPLDRLAGARVVAVAGIGRFESFVALLERAGAKVVAAMRFRDHYPYRCADVDAVRARCRSVGADFAVTTEKDAVKQEAQVAPGDTVWAVRMDVRVEDASAWSAWIDRVARLVAA